jgi:hypothetical protein
MSVYSCIVDGYLKEYHPAMDARIKLSPTASELSKRVYRLHRAHVAAKKSDIWKDETRTSRRGFKLESTVSHIEKMEKLAFENITKVHDLFDPNEPLLVSVTNIALDRDLKQELLDLLESMCMESDDEVLFVAKNVKSERSATKRKSTSFT